MSSALLLDTWLDEALAKSNSELIVEEGLHAASGELVSGADALAQWHVLEEGAKAWLARGKTRIEFVQAMEHQKELHEADSDRKLGRWGRRAGKTRVAYRSAVAGHGPLGEWSQGDGAFEQRWEGHKYRGILSGLDVVWLARDQVQARVIWFEELRPKFRGKPGVYFNDTEKYLTLEGCGSLYVRSNENIASVRGIGATLVGVVIDEAAWIDLEAALKDIILPALTDNEGWVMCISTTNAGRDGNPERPSGPSFFNILCERAIAARGESVPGVERQAPPEGEELDEELAEPWFENHRTARDNPRITARAFRKLQSEYDLESHSWQQEGEATLLKGLHGLMFKRWRDDLLRRAYSLTQLERWHWTASMDWGYSSPGWFGLGAFGPRKQEHLHAEYSFNGTPSVADNLTPYQVGVNIGKLLQQYPRPDWIWADSQMWEVGDGRGGKRAKTDADAVQDGINSIMGPDAPKLRKAVKGKGSRAARVRLFQESIRYTEVEEEGPDGVKKMVVPPWGLPRFSYHPRCVVFAQTVAALPVSPVNADDIDTDANDHPFDGWTYGTINRNRHGEGYPAKVGAHQHPGLQSIIERANPTAPENPDPRWERS